VKQQKKNQKSENRNPFQLFFINLLSSVFRKVLFKNSITQDDLVVSKLLGQDTTRYKSPFPHISAAIQLSNADEHPSKGDTIKYIYTNSLHKSPLLRVASIDSTNGVKGKLDYDKEKYKEMILDAAETVLGYFGYDRTLYGNKKKISKRKWWWFEELRQEREKDIMAETMESEIL
jgi:DNA polymerase elongation subunit (family B)